MVRELNVGGWAARPVVADGPANAARRYYKEEDLHPLDVTLEVTSEMGQETVWTPKTLSMLEEAGHP